VPGLKKKLPALGWGRAWAAVLVCVWALVVPQALRADSPRVLLVERPPARAELRSTLQIQLIGVAELGVRSDEAGDDTTVARIARGGALARAEGALAVVWVDPPLSRSDGATDVVLYIVGERAGRALVEVVHVPGSAGPELDRSLALKVREVVSDMLRAQANAPTEALLVKPKPARPKPAPPEPAAEGGGPSAAPTRWGLALYAGPRLSLQPGPVRLGLGVGGGPMLARAHYMLSATLALDVFPEVTARAAQREVRYYELLPKLQLELAWSFGVVRAGAHAGVGMSAIQATGSTFAEALGRELEHTESVRLWLLQVGLDVELPIASALALRARAELQALARRQYLAVDRDVLVDLGRVRAQFGLELVWRSRS